MIKFVFILLTVSVNAFASSSIGGKLPKVLDFECRQVVDINNDSNVDTTPIGRGRPSPIGRPMTMTLKIKHAQPGSYMPYVAEFTGPSVDKKTGMITPSKKFQMEGDTDLWTDDDGKEAPVIHLNQAGNPNHQIMLEKKVKKGEVADAVRYKDIADGRAEKMTCKVTKSAAR